MKRSVEIEIFYRPYQSAIDTLLSLVTIRYSANNLHGYFDQTPRCRISIIQTTKIQHLVLPHGIIDQTTARLGYQHHRLTRCHRHSSFFAFHFRTQRGAVLTRS